MKPIATTAIALGFLCTGLTAAHAHSQQFEPYELERAAIGLYEYAAVATAISETEEKAVENTRPHAGHTASKSHPERGLRLERRVIAKASHGPQQAVDQMK